MENLKTKDDFLQGKNILLALSGGVDSVVLLHYLAHYYPTNLRVIHCNHHLSLHCDEWQTFCQTLCSTLNIVYSYIDISNDNVANIEENARKKRYHALSSVLQKNEVLCTAHHQNDQAETLLLQLFRGSGVAGLAAMPRVKPFAAGVHYRPLLGIKKGAIMAYAKTHKFEWIEDDSNTNTDFRRNLLRLEFTPKLEKVYSNLTSTLARGAKHQAEALQLMHELAKLDIKTHLLINHSGRIKVSKLLKLDEYRIKNIIRYHLGNLNFLAPNNKVTAQIVRLLHAKTDANPLVKWGEFELRRFQDELYFINTKVVSKCPPCPLYAEFSPLPNFTIRYRTEGQRVILPNKTHSQALKKILQDANIPPWERNTLRMYYVGNKLRGMERIGKMRTAGFAD